MSRKNENKATATTAGDVGFASTDRRSGQEMDNVSEGIFYVLVSLLFLPLGIAYGCYLLYRLLHERI
jgi:hypothetical protein